MEEYAAVMADTPPTDYQPAQTVTRPWRSPDVYVGASGRWQTA